MKHSRLPLSLVVLSCLWTSQAPASILLTNGVRVTVGLPDTQAPTLFAGDIGYAIYVPPGAAKLTITWENAIPGFVVDVHVRYGADVGYSGTGATVQDYIAPDIGAGFKELVVTPQSTPPLQTGTYYIGFNVITIQPLGIDGFLTATVEGGSVPPVRTVAISTFDNDTDGWTSNTAPTSIAGATQGDLYSTINWQSSGGIPGGYLRHNEAGATTVDALVAPAKFLGNLGALVEPRFEFDFKQISGAPADFAVELRLMGAGTVFGWQGSIPPGTPDQIAYPLPPSFPPGGPPQNPPSVRQDSRWRRFTALLDRSQWTRLEGTARWVDVLANVQRIEVITDLVFLSESEAIDNFALLSRGVGPPPIVLAGNTSFASGADGWTRNYPASELAGTTTGDADSTFRWAPFEGNPTGYVRINDASGSGRDYLVAPARFLGTYQNITDPRFEFDYLHTSSGNPTRPIEIRLIGSQTVFVWTGPVPSRTWTHYVAPIGEATFVRASGNAALQQVLTNVERIEISADQAEGPETNSLDNFWLLSSSSPNPAPPALSANPLAVSFTAVARGANPAAQQIGVTSIGAGPTVDFTASASAARGNWLKISDGRGATPRTLNVLADITGLAEGNYTGQVTVVPGAGLSPQTVNVSLTVTARPSSAPRITAGGAVNAASSRNQLAPGALGTLYGTGFASGPLAASFLPGTTLLPSRLQSVRLLVNDATGALIAEAPLLYVSDSQINFQLPFETQGRAQVQLVVDNNGVWSDPLAIQVLPAAPGIFTYGQNRAVAVNQNGTVNSPENPALRGTFLTVYTTGQGMVASVPTGTAAPARPLVRMSRPARAWIGNVPADIVFLGLTPGLVGVLQMNLVVPENAPFGDSALVLNIDGLNSNSPVVSVR